ncbi:pyruvate synthase [Solemya velum gill symbiont]|uniref:Pyruvate ferredoxin oxidoreductase, beta subunit n=1 Tax=Solemya velum gill symbiont TaxID=2340 RepID=A0A0B0HAU1_SOVGS|nr:thiamine pyrophosphate-dependent enzyme [Solemya velum gill symbiont]KHF25782.1 pyruvate ferredoxin oxidoreductase, beta subunit [Solemya velum gill symbiont]OOY35631.1 pyruvate synthase [Solemya velum gill symbiont]OOY38259.1 pyruvate synthase [Solemya velum gill symbiont]OOY39894.1 pyruvate synthase [Solemya velum gill symbiont]OOY46982.1 pyruvate synthase [Solemya velum gill symbiont]
MSEKIEKMIRSTRDLPSTHLLGTGTPMCAGCGGLEALNGIYDILGEKTVFVNAAGCMTLLSVYPFTPFRGSWLYTAMASAPAGAQGIRDALDILLEQKRITTDDDLEVVVLTGDGAAYGMGLSATSGAMERNLDFIYVCYDNEGYGNTGQQYSGATPHAAKTATSRGFAGFRGYKKDLFSIWAAHNPAYVATVIGAEPLDLAKKIEKLRGMKGPRMIIALSPCPTGWDFDPRETVHIGQLALKSGIWPLKEYIDGKVTHTKVPRKRVPVEDYLSLQGRFRHLFEPTRNEKLLDEIQARVDSYWEKIEQDEAEK